MLTPVRRNKSLGDLTGLSGLGFHIIEVRPGHESTELHVHYYEEECVYVLEGEAEATIGDKTYTVRAGDFIGYRAGGENQMPLKAYVVRSPNYRLQRTVRRHHVRGASSAFHCALAARWTRHRAAAEPGR